MNPDRKRSFNEDGRAASPPIHKRQNINNSVNNSEYKVSGYHGNSNSNYSSSLPNSAQNSPNPHNGNEWHGQANVNSNSSSGNAMNSSSSSSSSSNDVVSFNQIPWERLDFVDTKDIDEKKLDPKILKVQNMALGRQLNVNKKAISLLEDQLSKFEKKHIETLTQLQTLNSSWNSLDKELSILIEKINPSGGNFPKPNFDTDNDSNSEFQERVTH